MKKFDSIKRERGKGRTMLRLRGVLSSALCLAAAICLAVSCIYDDFSDSEESTDGVATLSISMKVASTGTTSGYEAGTDYENYIDMAGGDCRIYFFTNSHPSDGGSDTFIAEFSPSTLTEYDASSDYEWYMRGDVPTALLNQTDFKVVVLANWGSYPSPSDGTSLKDICSPSTGAGWGIFDRKTDFSLSEDNLIPFYGVSAYTGIEFKPNKTTKLDDPVNLIRAMAKIEIVLENSSEVDFDSVTLHGYNEQGYCAPEDVYDQYDYTSRGTDGWNYINDSFDLHLIGGENNDSGQEGRAITMLKGVDDEGRYVWRAYVPEYRNISEDSKVDIDYAYIQVNLPDFEPDLEDYRIYFRNYVDGSASAGADYNIGRNVLYRFTVTVEAGFRFKVEVDVWEDSFYNDFTFGNADDDA